MGTFRMEQATTDVALDKIAALANEIWHEHFVPIIGLDQVNYMVGKFQSYPALKDQVKEGYEYYRIFCGDAFAGYAGIRPEEDALFLSKLYLHKDYRGQHLSTKALEFLKDYCHKLDVYHHLGFSNVRSQVADIGNGYVMDDYILELEV